MEGFRIPYYRRPEMVNISGSKTWDDNNNQDGARPNSIEIILLANGTQVDSKWVTEQDEWSWNFEDMPFYQDGSEVVYSILERAVGNYTTEIDGYDVTNTHTPEKRSIQVVKIWDDENDKDQYRPEEITIRLQANGEETEEILVLNETNNWQGAFADLDMYQGGQLIEYTVSEDAVDKYSTKIEGDALVGFIITNRHVPDEIPDTGDDPEPTDPEEQQDPVEPTSGEDIPVAPQPGQTPRETIPFKGSRNPQTGDTFAYGMVFALLISSVLLFFVTKKSREEEQ